MIRKLFSSKLFSSCVNINKLLVPLHHGTSVYFNKDWNYYNGGPYYSSPINVTPFQTTLLSSMPESKVVTVVRKRKPKDPLNNQLKEQILDSLECKNEECLTSAEGRQKHCEALMCEHFNLSQNEAKDVMKENPLLWKTFFHKSFDYLKSLGLEKAIFIAYPNLIAVSPNELDSKLSLIRENFPDFGNVNASAGIILLPSGTNDLKKLIELWKKESIGKEYPSKFHYLADVLKVPVSKVLNEIRVKPFLVGISFNKVRSVVDLLLKEGISVEELWGDLWIAQHCEQYIRQRIETLRHAKVPIKLWLLRAANCRFDAHVRRFIEEKALEERYSDFKTYVINRFNCDSAAADKFVKSWPRVRSPGLPRLEKILDFFLIEKGIDPTIMISNMRILNLNLESIRTRVGILEANGIQVETCISALGKTPKAFQIFVEKYSTLEPAETK